MTPHRAIGAIQQSCHFGRIDITRMLAGNRQLPVAAIPQLFVVGASFGYSERYHIGPDPTDRRRFASLARMFVVYRKLAD
jgi:hypothetical protein